MQLVENTSITARPHAQKVNAKFKNENSIYVDLHDRWKNALASLSVNERNSYISRLNTVIKKFRAAYPKITHFNDTRFRICKSLSTALDKILIDSTIQRELDLEWILVIIENFLAHQAMPIQVYPVPKDNIPLKYFPGDDFFASWDGQHTAVAFYIISTMIFNERPQDVQVPIVIYSMESRQECRMTFMNNNGKEGKKLLDPIDKITQMIYGVRLDNSKIPLWEEVEKKQRYLEAYDLFMTDSKFFDNHEPGAITRPGDLCDPKYSPEMVKQFAVYADRVLSAGQRAINTKEMPIIMGFLKMAAGDNVNYTDDEIRSLADLCLSKFGADFDEHGIFWNQVGIAYTKWHAKAYEDYDLEMRPGVRLNKDWIQGGTFFYFQLYHSWKDTNGKRMRLPKLNISSPFLPNKSDLF